VPTLEQLAYEIALRSLEKQEALLTELRARTGVLVAASSLAVAFLGRPALEDGRGILVVCALAAFAVSTGAAIYVLLPKGNLTFSLEGSRVYERLFEFREDMPEIHRRLTYDLDRFWDANDAVLTRLFRWFTLSGLGLAVEIVLLLAAVSGNLF
jgi:hypothetical protein